LLAGHAKTPRAVAKLAGTSAGKPIWVSPEGPDRSWFLKYTAVSAQP